jgi:hypothetical protein
MGKNCFLRCKSDKDCPSAMVCVCKNSGCFMWELSGEDGDYHLLDVCVEWDKDAEP